MDLEHCDTEVKNSGIPVEEVISVETGSSTVGDLSAQKGSRRDESSVIVENDV